MEIKHVTPELMRGMAATSVPTPEQQDHLEVRILTLYVTISFINDLIGPITYIYQLTPSLLYRVASLAHGQQGAWAVGSLFVMALLLAVPHAVALVFFPNTLAKRWPRKLATVATVLVTLAWAYLAVLSLPLDAGPLFWLYQRQAIDSLGLAFIYAISLNAQLLRAIYAALKSR